MDARRMEFVRKLGETGSVKETCLAMGIARRTYDRWRKADADFAFQCDLIIQSNREARRERRSSSRDECILKKESTGEDRRETRLPSGISDNRGSGISDTSAYRDERTAMEEELRSAMRAAGTYGEQWEPQIKLTARAGAWVMMSEREIAESEMTVSSTSREGDARVAVHPLHVFYLKQLERYQAGLRALGLNLDSRNAPKAAGQGDRESFFASLMEDD